MEMWTEDVKTIEQATTEARIPYVHRMCLSRALVNDIVLTRMASNTRIKTVRSALSGPSGKLRCIAQ